MADAWARGRITKLMATLAQAGSTEALRDLYFMLRPFAVAYVRSRTSRTDLVEDIVQESFLRLREISSRYREGADGFSFFYGVLKNVTREHLRNSRVAPRTWLADTPASGEDPPSGEGQSQEDDGHSAFSAKLASALANLPPKLAQAVQLRVLEGLSSEDAARRAGCSSVALRKRLSRALRRLRSRLSGPRSGAEPEC